MKEYHEPQSKHSPLAPEHLGDLRRSGLTDETIATYKIESVRPADLAKVLSPRAAAKVVSSYRIPYPAADGYIRHKIFPPIGKQKYDQAIGADNRLFVTHTAEKARTDPRVELWIVEGEKKALAAEQVALAAIGIGGIWNWLQDGKPIADLDNWDYCERPLIVAADSDIWTRPDLLQAAYALGKELESRGASVRIVKLPAGKDRETQGLDDFLVARSRDELFRCSQLELKHKTFGKVREWWKAWSKEKQTERSKAGKLSLSDPEPWESSVQAGELLETVSKLIRRFIVCDEEHVIAASLWVLHSYTLDAFDYSPQLTITSPTMRCGKTRLLTLLFAMARRAILGSSFSPASIYRAVEKWGPTLIVDEFESAIAENEDLRAIMNSAHYRPAAFVPRCVGDSNDVVLFPAFCCKAVALIGRLSDANRKAGTLEDRSIILELKRKTKAEKTDRFSLSELAVETGEFKRKAIRWGKDFLEALRGSRPALPEILNDRARDHWSPFFAISELAGGEWPELARQTAIKLSAEVEETTASVMLLEDIKALFDDSGEDALSSKYIVEALAELEERPWPEWKRLKPITSKQVAGLLKTWKIGPDQMRLDGPKTRGYHKKDFVDASTRYLPGTPGTHPKNQQLTEDLPGTKMSECTGWKSPKVLQTNDVPGVPDRNPPGEGKEKKSAEKPDWECLAEEAALESRALAAIESHHPGGLPGWKKRIETVREKEAATCLKIGDECTGVPTFETLRARIRAIGGAPEEETADQLVTATSHRERPQSLIGREAESES